MIINWLKKNFSDYPKFYQKYLETFENSSNGITFIVFDFEINTNNDLKSELLSICAYKIVNNSIILNENIQIKVQNKLNFNNENTVIETEAIIQFLDFIKNYPLISYKINSKIEIINLALKKLDAEKIENELFTFEILFNYFENNKENIDISLEKIAQKLKLSDYSQDTLIEKVYLEALIFLKLNSKIDLSNILK
jgi:DNA polymerase-3 subunit epsilon